MSHMGVVWILPSSQLYFCLYQFNVERGVFSLDALSRNVSHLRTVCFHDNNPNTVAEYLCLTVEDASQCLYLSQLILYARLPVKRKWSS